MDGWIGVCMYVCRRHYCTI